MKKFITIAFLLMNCFCFGQITFIKTFGGDYLDWATSAQQTNDGGYIITGRLQNGQIWDSADVSLVKTNMFGDTLWTRTFGGSGEDYGRAVEQTTDSGYIVAGSTENLGVFNIDVYLIKTDVNGDTLWTQTIGNGGNDLAYNIRQVTDGGYIVVGSTSSYGAGNTDVYLIRANSLGDTLWTRTFGGSNADNGYSVRQTSDGGFIITASSLSFVPPSKIYLIRTDSLGDTLWTKTYSGIGNCGGSDALQTTDGGFIVVGKSDMSSNSDIYLIKTAGNGDTLWTKTYGGTDDDLATSILQEDDGGFIVAGSVNSTGQFSGTGLLMKTNSFGDTLWTRSYSGSGDNVFLSVSPTNDGGFVLSSSMDSAFSGYYNMGLIKTDSLGNTGCNDESANLFVSNPPAIVDNPPTIVSSGGVVTRPATLIGSGTHVNTLCFSVGVNNLSEQNISSTLSPNPFHTTATLTINSQFLIPNSQLKIYDVLGKCVHTQAINNRQSTIINTFPAGIYFYQVTNDKGQMTNGKFVVE